ncbi:ADP-ribosylglycohydrolase [Tenacibaculum sp. 190524A02b]|uniref:ADP-ribosylglycohydrolase family protein n=1 Tax=Tenacibaculum vairaonense TaxID=3137860 RepID=UPI0032B160F9
MKSNIIEATFLGLAVGDALGVPVEFRSRKELQANPVKDMREYGTHNQPKGTWSDDSSLTFCLAESLCKELEINLIDISKNFINWLDYGFWTPHGKVFDIGIQTRQSIYQLAKIINSKEYSDLELLKYSNDEYTNGNGSLMRIIPLLFHIKDFEINKQFETIWFVSSLTHPHIRSAIACFIYLQFAKNIIEGNTLIGAYRKMQKKVNTFFDEKELSSYEKQHFSRVLNNNITTLRENEIKSGGYVIDTLEASLWCLMTSSGYKETVLKAVNLGDDTDTTATVAGAIAGLYYGMEAIPKEWVEVLARKNDIISLSKKFAKKYGYEKQ